MYLNSLSPLSHIPSHSFSFHNYAPYFRAHMTYSLVFLVFPVHLLHDPVYVQTAALANGDTAFTTYTTGAGVAEVAGPSVIQCDIQGVGVGEVL